MNKKQIILIVIVAILLIAIPLSLYLVRQRQIVRSRADEPNVSVQFVDDSGQVITETHNPNVKLRIILPIIPATSSAGIQI